MRSENHNLFGRSVEIRELPLAWLARNPSLETVDLEQSANVIACCTYVDNQRLWATGQELLDQLGASQLPDIQSALHIILRLSGFGEDQKKTI